MKSEVKKKEKVTPDYPKLMVCTNEPDVGMVVLMWNVESGVVVVSTHKNRPLGYQSTSWRMEYFEDFDGSITLTNE